LATTAGVIASVLGGPALGGDDEAPRLASQTRTDDVVAHPKQSPPRDLIAAGRTALAAYAVSETVDETEDRRVHRNTWYLLDQKTGKYVKADKWSVLDVAPGMRTAVVLERELPARRIGLLDLLTGEIERWIPVEQGVAGVKFSPDGRQVVATTYSGNPDVRLRHDRDLDGDGKLNDYDWDLTTFLRTGFYVLDVDTGKGSWSEVPVRHAEHGLMEINLRQDFAFTDSGKLVYSGLMIEPGNRYYDFAGKETSAPANEKHLAWSVEARLSPNGKLAAGGFAGGARTTASEIIDPYTGKRLHKIRGQQLLAWADDKRLIAWDIAQGGNEHHSGLVLVEIGSDKVVPLSGPRKGSDLADGRWEPVFATR
ncbi:WD40 repeat domain-containing protein, partial [Streptomyces mesophilus]|uniref:WD40 repeat domain-containing protein n=1 Tax=Streptomyces mesophilus TaxID=1775132 RepID=UPI003322EF68